MRVWLVMLMTLMTAGFVSAAGIHASQVYGCDIALSSYEEGRYDLNTWDCEHYVFDSKGITQVIDGVPKQVSNFMVVGTSGAIFNMSGYSGNWEWSVDENSSKQVLMSGHVLIGGIDMYASAIEQFEDTGLTIEYKPKNSSGKNFSNTLFAFTSEVTNPKPLTYYQNGKSITYKWDKNVLITDKNILKQLAPILEDEQSFFMYKDVIDNNYTLGAMALGNLKYFYQSLPNESGYILGFTANDGKFDNGAEFNLDPVLDVNMERKNIIVGTADWNIYFQQNLGAGITFVSDLNRNPTINVMTGTTKPSTGRLFDRWIASKGGSAKEETNDITARLSKAEDLNSRVQIISESSMFRAIAGGAVPFFDLNTMHLQSFYPWGRTATGHGLLKMVVHLEFKNTNDVNATNYTNFSHDAYVNLNDFNAYSDNNTSVPDVNEWWVATQSNNMGSTVDANQVFVVGYSGSRAQRFYNRMWNPTSAALWTTSGSCLNDGAGVACWSDSDLNPEFQVGEMQFLNYVIFFGDTNFFGAFQGRYAPDQNLIDYVMLDWRNPDDPFYNVGSPFQSSRFTFDYNTGVYDTNVGIFDGNAERIGIDVNVDTHGYRQSLRGGVFFNDTNTLDANRYNPTFRINNYTADHIPVVKINGQVATYDVNYVADVNFTGQYAVVVMYDTIMGVDQNKEYEITSAFKVTEGQLEQPVAVEELPICMMIRDIDEPAINEGICVLCEGDANYLK